MGVDLKDIVITEKIGIESLRNKVIGIDAFNAIYQFLSTIRQYDGSSLKDSHGNVTSHLSGLFYRTIKLMKFGIKPVYVFDGTPPELKFKTLERRSILKEIAKEKYIEAIEKGNFEDAKKFAKRTSKITEDMIEESKLLLESMGIPCVQAPSEGEMQCAYMNKKNDIFATATQDYDALLFGAPRVIRNLTFSGEKELELIKLEDVLKNLGITHEQLVEIGILVGTDFNEGIKGIGPKTAYKKVKNNEIKNMQFDFDFESVKKIFLNLNFTDNYKINFKEVDEEKVIEILCKNHDFSIDRVKKGINELKLSYAEKKQKGLEEWF